MLADLRRRFRSVLSGSDSGVPEWNHLIEEGEDFGLFSPEDAPWVVHADVATFIGGIRALLMQAMHPGSLAGVMQHSRYEEDALGRLVGTIRWLSISTFGSTTAFFEESRRVAGMHERVRGSYRDEQGERVDYSASDSALLEWVHIAFTDSFLEAHLLYGERAIPGGADAYVGHWAKAVVPLGLAEPPNSEAQLRLRIKEFDPVLRVDERTRRVVEFIRRPPLPGAGPLVYRLLFAAAVESLPQSYRERLGLRALPSWLIRPVARAAMSVLRVVLGDDSPIEGAALARHARLRASRSDD